MEHPDPFQSPEHLVIAIVQDNTSSLERAGYLRQTASFDISFCEETVMGHGRAAKRPYLGGLYYGNLLRRQQARRAYNLHMELCPNESARLQGLEPRHCSLERAEVPRKPL